VFQGHLTKLYYITVSLPEKDGKQRCLQLALSSNDGHENDGPSKLQGMKSQDMKMQDMKLQDMKLQYMTRIDSILFNFSFFCIVMLTLQQWNCVT